MRVSIGLMSIMLTAFIPQMANAQTPIKYDLMPNGFGINGVYYDWTSIVLNRKESKAYDCLAREKSSGPPPLLLKLTCAETHQLHGTVLNGDNVVTRLTPVAQPNPVVLGFWQIDQVAGDLIFCALPSGECGSTRVP
ncbi:hypothetical protein [Bradyrhizobium erythrophlei]|uniref:Protease inhibitor Inh n=1 Tax=Bradyrhizobium erythrophlei TaxID=1437360 RepID=A0A1M5PY26_9BRAD|nr:hypothetical protein [Bradyrhizobium erythrophlei]SHH06907.1 hypothetical protein SAMN05443248_3571 [Bradyrhizobium erythrophlei]